jgi:hypothetical protein
MAESDAFNHQFHPVKCCLWQPSFGELTGQAIMNHQSNNQLIRISSVSFGKVIVEGKKIGG